MGEHACATVRVPAKTTPRSNGFRPSNAHTEELQTLVHATMLLEGRNELRTPSMEHTRRLFQAPLPSTP